MIAYSGYNTKLYYGPNNGTTETTYSSSDLSGKYEIDNSQLVVVVSEPQQEADAQEEPNVSEALVYWERPHRRLATVTGLRRINRSTPQQATSTWG
jgi:hypothetical protein